MAGVVGRGTAASRVIAAGIEAITAQFQRHDAEAVVGLPDETWGEAVHAIVVCAPDAVSADELEAHARKRIAGFKVPRGWTFQTDPLPVSAAGKVLKRELRERLS